MPIIFLLHVVLLDKIPRGLNVDEVGSAYDAWSLGRFGVDRWMKFTGAVGIHGASWRSKFGGDIYKYNGSHGCVNLPHDVALNLYDMVDIGTMVVVH